MSTVLTPDTTLRLPAATLLNASAGSGKTHALSLRFVQFLLSDRIPNNGFRRMMALTFTNAAAAEMKQRILGGLKGICLGDAAMLADIKELVSLPEKAIAARAAAVLEEILENYSEFQVKTIDSFMVSVFRTQAIDAGFLPDAQVILSSDELVRYAFDLLSRDFTEGSQASNQLDALVELMLFNRAPDASFLWNPYAAVVKEVLKLHGRLAHFPVRPHAQDHRARMEHLKSEIEQEALQLEKLIDASGFEIKSNAAKALEAARHRDILDLMKRARLADPVKKPKSKTDIETFAAWLPRINEHAERMNAAVDEFAALHAEQYYQPIVAGMAMLDETLDRVKRQQGEVLLEDVARYLAGHLTEATIPEVFLKLGEKLHHYLIDEFQDTSPVQWQVLLPLVENALAGEGSLFVVGDTKQSIFGFRGADWRIMKSLEHGMTHVFPSVARPEILELPSNYRSEERLVEFAKEMFQEICPAQEMGTQAEMSGLLNYRQEAAPAKRDKGWAEVKILEKQEDTAQEAAVLSGYVNVAHQRGYAWGEIAVLTRSNNDVVEISSWLNAAAIPFVSYSSLDARTRTVAGELIALFRFLDAPVDACSFATFLLGTVFERAMAADKSTIAPERLRSCVFECREAGSPPLYKVFSRHFPGVWSRFFEHLFNVTGYMPVYDLVAESCKVFRVFETFPEEEACFSSLLESALTFEGERRNSLKDFLAYSDQSEVSWDMQVPRGTDAVRVMTIHKSKGLGFPVVCLLLRDTRGVNNNLFLGEEEERLRLLRITKEMAERVPALSTVYAGERLRQEVDDLNKLYVAVTRAEEEMMVIGVQKREPKMPTKLFPQWTDGRGKKHTHAAPAGDVRPGLHILHHQVPGHAATSRKQIDSDEIRRGECIHGILAGILCIDGDVEAQIAEAASALPPVRLSVPVIAGAKDAAARFLNDPDARHLFSRQPGRTVLVEQELINRAGELFRVDRVIVDPEELLVVDFKTGGNEREAEYLLQVRNYMRLFAEIHPGKTVRGCIAYVDRVLLRSVE